MVELLAEVSEACRLAHRIPGLGFGVYERYSYVAVVVAAADVIIVADSLALLVLSASEGKLSVGFGDYY